MNIKRFSKIIFNFAIIITTLFVATTIVNAENTISTSTEKQTNITQSTDKNEEGDSTQQKKGGAIVTQSTKEKSITTKATKKNYQYVRFFINYKSEALDSEGNVGAQDPDKFTPMLWECDVKNATANTKYYIAGESKDNSYKADKQIRKLVGDKKDGSIYIVSFPTDEYIFKELKQYVNTLSIDGKNIKVDELNTDHYEVRWYVLKLHSNFLLMSI